MCTSINNLILMYNSKEWIDLPVLAELLVIRNPNFSLVYNLDPVSVQPSPSWWLILFYCFHQKQLYPNLFAWIWKDGCWSLILNTISMS